MKILAVADEESKYLWEYYEPSKLRDIDLIIGCGDLSLHYMNFLSDAAPVPVLYVHGNHDASYDKEPPRGAICIDDDLYWYKGYRIVGLGGSCRYRAGAWQFTEAEMKRRISTCAAGSSARAGWISLLPMRRCTAMGISATCRTAGLRCSMKFWIPITRL